MTVEDLMAHTEIQKALYRYCRGVDRGDARLICSAYHEDAIDHHGPWTGTGPEFGPHIVAKMDLLPEAGQHHITNILIELDGESARVESYFLVLQPTMDNGHFWLSGRYLDLFECRNGAWKIADRTVVQDVSKGTTDKAWPGMSGYPIGGRRQDDPSAGWFQTAARGER